MAWWALYLSGWALFSAADFGLSPEQFVVGFTFGRMSDESSG